MYHFNCYFCGMKVKKSILLSMWGDLLKSIITNESEGKDSQAVKFFTTSYLPYDFDETNLELTIFATQETVDRFESNFNNKDSEYYQFYQYLIDWIRDIENNHDNKRMRLAYVVIGDKMREVELSAYKSIKMFMPQLINHVESKILGEEFYEEVKRKKAVMFDSLIARKSAALYKQSNKLTRAKVGLTLTQKKTLTYLIWKYQNTDLFQKNLFGDVSISVDVKELQECGCGTNVKQIIKSLKGLGKETWMEYTDENNKIVAATLFTKFEAEDGSKEVNVTFSQVMTTLINKIATYKEYTVIDRDTLTAVKSYASARMYELCSQFRYSQKYVFQMKDEELRRILNCEEKYKDPKDFKKWVLQVAQKELKKLYEQGQSDLYFEFSEKEKQTNHDCQSKYKRKNVVSWIFIVRKDLSDMGYVENDDNEERRKYIESTLEQIIACYVADEVELSTLRRQIMKMSDKNKFEIARELQASIKKMTEQGETYIREIINKYRFQSL